ncbi:MAG: helix-turn-helix domain-containing protein [Chitinophagales bacterium]
MKLYIKNMVSIRCKMIVKSELAKIGVHDGDIQLGEVSLRKDLPEADYTTFKTALKKVGFELLEDKRSKLIEKIKNVIVEMVHYADELPKTNFSDYLSEKLGLDYTYLSNLFSEVQGITIEHFIIYNKIEKVKELLVYDELTLTQISYKLHYSSVAHLSNQFKKITGLTPSHFKLLRHKRRRGLENL